MRIVPLDLDQANLLVKMWHRHHQPVRGYKFALGAVKDDQLVGAVIVGRPVSRMADNGATLEITRLVTNGTKNACSFLYSAAARVAKEMGYVKIQTYILNSETGVSLHAAGWHKESTTRGGEWSRENRPRDTPAPIVPKDRYAKYLNEPVTLAACTVRENKPQDKLL